LNEQTKFDSRNDNRATLPRFTAEAMKTNRVLVDLLNEFGQRKGATVSQVALAWVLSQKPWIVPIPGTTKLERLEENLRSADLEFTPEEWCDLNQAVSKIKLQGDRYPTDQETENVTSTSSTDCVSRLCALLKAMRENEDLCGSPSACPESNPTYMREETRL